MCKRYPKRNCTNVNNYVQAVKKIRLELDKKHIEDNKEEQGEKQTEEEEQSGMQLEEGEEPRKSEEYSKDEGVNNKKQMIRIMHKMMMEYPLLMKKIMNMKTTVIITKKKRQ